MGANPLNSTFLRFQKSSYQQYHSACQAISTGRYQDTKGRVVHIININGVGTTLIAAKEMHKLGMAMEQYNAYDFMLFITHFLQIS